MAKKLTKEEFIERARKVHGDKYDYSLTKYNGRTKNVTIICPNHGEFTQKASDHLSGCRCQKCSIDEFGSREKFNNESFKQRSEEVHGTGIYDYSLVDYKISTEKVTIICKKHGPWETLPSTHIRGRGCRKCAGERNAERTRSTTEKFIQKAIEVYGEEKYSYCGTEYKKSKEKVEIKCNSCGSTFLVTPSNHLRGSGCPSCSRTGFNPACDGLVYVLQADDWVKVGITGVYAENRLKRINYTSPRAFEMVYHIRLDGRTCEVVEKSVLKRLRAEYENPAIKFHGSSEVFVGVPLVCVVDLITTEVNSLFY